ncbi:DNA adenine methylase [Staphylococcus caprae]|uniref:DNA adenine methylase n=1 Tax=Staphylococcus caprae TaxID=29380 RepID=UPI0019D15672|nr:DNA adenine methylase [Staphylococcus caprae]MBN6826744.1 DNA adenine methylase [Staphylococcus caprae]
MTNNLDKNLKPIIKYVGGKSKVLPTIKEYMPKSFNTYYEPFIGGGSVLFGLRPQKAVINDISKELINIYKVVRDNPEALITDLKQHINEKDYYYFIRSKDRDETIYNSMTDVQKASRLIYLNKTGFNGLIRFNKKGQFNVPMGKYANPNIVNESVIRAVSKYLNDNDIKITNLDFVKACENAKAGDFIYADSPYIPLSKTSSFVSYSAEGFSFEDQIRLRDLAIDLNKRGCKIMLSNSSSELVFDLYKDFKIKRVKVARAINSKATARGKIDEVIITNY